MPGRRNIPEAAATESSAVNSETLPLIKAIPPPTLSKVCCFACGAVLVFLWCTFDKMNRATADALFGLKKMENVTGEPIGPLNFTDLFQYPLTLAFFQFVFMGLLFLGIWRLFSLSAGYDLAKVRENLFSPAWTSLALTHVFSTFWLQALMMPGQMMSLGVFAASRALEVPATAALRSSRIGIGGRFGGHPLATTALMAAAAWLLTYAYSQISQCLCIWSGHGVELAGVALFFIYALVLILPAANVVCLETVMVRFDTNPFLMLGTVNIVACVFLCPILLFAHVVGWEDVGQAMQVTLSNPEIYMLVIWLCIDMSILSAVGVGLVSLTDSFWAVGLRSLRVVYWWLSQLSLYYFFSDSGVLSVDRPDASFWGFIILCGTFLVSIAMVVDQNASDKAFQGQDACGLIGKYRSPEKASDV